MTSERHMFHSFPKVGKWVRLFMWQVTLVMTVLTIASFSCVEAKVFILVKVLLGQIGYTESHWSLHTPVD